MKRSLSFEVWLRRAVGVALQIPPLRILLVDDAFHSLGQGRQSHLNEVARMVDGLGQRSCEHDQIAACGNGA